MRPGIFTHQVIVRLRSINRRLDHRFGVGVVPAPGGLQRSTCGSLGPGGNAAPEHTATRGTRGNFARVSTRNAYFSEFRSPSLLSLNRHRFRRACALNGLRASSSRLCSMTSPWSRSGERSPNGIGDIPPAVLPPVSMHTPLSLDPSSCGEMTELARDGVVTCLPC